jgi:hypothetical protein
MAGKLKDDEIRWILSLDAKGVQAEFQKISSSTNKLVADNKMLKAELQAIEKQIKATEKEMARLERVGATSSIKYKELQGTLASAKGDMTDFTVRMQQNTKAIEENNKKSQELLKTMKVEDMTMDQLRQRANQLQAQLDRTSVAADPKAYKQLQRELTATQNRMGTLKNANASLMTSLTAIPGPIGMIARSVQGLGVALKVLLANPVIAIIAAIVVVFMALAKVINSNEESMHKLNQILAPFKLLIDSILHALQKGVVFILDFVQSVLSGISDLIDQFPFLKKYLGDINEKAKEAIQLEKDKQALQLRQREELVNTAQKELKIAELRNDSRKRDVHSAKERIGLLDQAIALEKEISKEKVYQAEESLRLLELEAKRTKSETEMADAIAQGKANVYNAEKEFYSHTLRLERERSAAVLEIRQEQEQAAKEAMENRLKEIDRTLDLEINKLKKARMKGLLTEKEYNDKVEEMTVASIQKKIDVKGQEEHQLIKYQAQILDAQIKQQEAADKVLLDELTKTKDHQVQLIEAAKNAQLESLQETETDQIIYALRAKEIEAQAADGRLAVIKQFSETLKEAEFNNVQNRKAAIEENNKEVLSAEKTTLKAREDQQKLFAKTTADFERQYNIKTWEQRKEDELRIIEKQHQLGLLSEETYQAALKVIEKKYADEKLKVRQQYGIASMKELYEAEMQALQEQHDLQLLSEEEFEKARLQIKLKYAQEYAQKANELLSATSDAVSTLMDAETANMEARYDAEIAAAGDNAEEVERLENEKAKKKLDIEKKYADVQFAITAAEIISNTAMAIMQAFAQLGPIAGGIAAVLMGVTGAAQLAVANAERKKVKNMSLDNSSSSSGNKTGQIVMRKGYVEGGSNIGDHTDGGYTSKGDRHDIAGWVPYHHGEYFVAVPEMKDPIVMDHVRAIDKIRRRRTTRNPLPAGFAEGGSNTDSRVSRRTTVEQRQENEVSRKLLALLTGLTNGDISLQTNYGITELEAQQQRKQEVESNFSLD